jgi:hypothetical protein
MGAREAATGEHITPEEASRMWAELRARRASEDDPLFREYVRRLGERNQALFDRFARPYLATDPGRWIAISLEGDVILGDTASEVGAAAQDRFGPGRYAKARLADFRGHRFLF